MCYYGEWGLYSYVFVGEESIATINFTPKPSCDPFWPHPFARGGYFSQEIVKYCYMCYYGEWGLYSYVFVAEESIATINFTPKPSCDPFWPHPFARGGYF
jgi:hypothetical protein